ncbi:MAG TPA: sulfatase-like hydrolase/transferase [Geminicoccaceae bacterium]|nr:sulfatase-like hydrolase/transferase [Geminicoccaceae bacterium]
MTAPANLVVFQSDNHARRMAGCYGHPIVRTPTLDRVAGGGVRFASAYSPSPLCCPARAAIATGRFPHETSYWDNALAYDGRVPSWMRRLRDQGHEVVSVGKLHYRSADDDNGFSEEIAPMHIVGGLGGLVMLLRWCGEEPVRHGQWGLYAERSGIGDTEYQRYDVEISERAIAWLKRHAAPAARPWVLYVSYVSPHPPFLVPQRLWGLYPPERMPLPVQCRPEERPEHPAAEHVRRIMGFRTMEDADMLRRVAAGYAGLVTHLDEQIGRVLAAAEDLGLLERTRVMYLSDHGEAAGAHGLFGKCTLYETSAGVPLLAMGPGIPAGRVSRQLVSLVDLFPTIVEGAGGELLPEDATLPGVSLWPAVGGRDDLARPVFAEYHAAASRAASFMLRERSWKLIHHVGMPAQLFDLEVDPDETADLATTETRRVAAMTARLRCIVDPEAVDARAKADQRRRAEECGGKAAILERGAFVYTPPPGTPAAFRPSTHGS